MVSLTESFSTPLPRFLLGRLCPRVCMGMKGLHHGKEYEKRRQSATFASIINKVDKDVFVPACSIHLFIISCSALQSYLESPWSDQYQRPGRSIHASESHSLPRDSVLVVHDFTSPSSSSSFVTILYRLGQTAHTTQQPIHLAA